MGNFLVWVIWILAALACISTGIAVISFTNPFYSALALIGNLASLAVLFLLASAEFVAAAQILVYAGAVMVMFLFVIAYLGGRADAPWAGGPRWLQLGAFVVGAAILVEVIVALVDQGRRRALRQRRDRTLVRQPGGDRPALPHRPPARVRDHLDRPARRRRRRRRARHEGRGGGRAPNARPRHDLVPRRRRRPLRDRHDGRDPAAQPADRAALARDHAQRVQPRPRRLLAPLRRRSTARSSRSP